MSTPFPIKIHNPNDSHVKQFGLRRSPDLSIWTRSRCVNTRGAISGQMERRSVTAGKKATKDPRLRFPIFAHDCDARRFLCVSFGRRKGWGGSFRASIPSRGTPYRICQKSSPRIIYASRVLPRAAQPANHKHPSASSIDFNCSI